MDEKIPKSDQQEIEIADSPVFLRQIYTNCGVCRMPGNCIQAYQFINIKQGKLLRYLSPKICIYCIIENMTEEFDPTDSQRHKIIEEPNIINSGEDIKDEKTPEEKAVDIQRSICDMVEDIGPEVLMSLGLREEEAEQYWKLWLESLSDESKKEDLREIIIQRLKFYMMESKL